MRHDDIVDERRRRAEVVLLEQELRARVVDVRLAAARSGDEQPVARELDPGRGASCSARDEGVAAARPQVAAEDLAGGDGADVEGLPLDLDSLGPEARRELDDVRKRLLLRRRDAGRESSRDGYADRDRRDDTNHACLLFLVLRRKRYVRRGRTDRSFILRSWSRRSTCSTSRSSRGAGTTSLPTCRT